MTKTLFPFKAGDIFFCRGKGWQDKLINFFQHRKSKDGDTRCSHTGVVIDDQANTLETTPWLTGNLNLGANYAGSDLVVLRWKRITPLGAQLGYEAVEHQKGKVYPYWRLLAQALGWNSWWHGSNMECCVLAAHYIFAAGFVLKEDNLWKYDTEMLHDELRASPEWEVVFEGSQRLQGHIVEI